MDDSVLMERLNDNNKVEINVIDGNRLLKNLYKFTQKDGKKGS